MNEGQRMRKKIESRRAGRNPFDVFRRETNRAWLGLNMMTEAKAGFRAFNEGARGAREVDFVKLRRLLAEYPEQVRLAFVHMPVVERDSGPAAVAAEAARRQGAFWGMHDALFALQGSPLRETDLRAAARELGLDVERFSADLRDRALLERVRADLAVVDRLGIEATPALLVNGLLYVGLLSSDDLRRLLRWARDHEGDFNRAEVEVPECGCALQDRADSDGLRIFGINGDLHRPTV